MDNCTQATCTTGPPGWTTTVSESAPTLKNATCSPMGSLFLRATTGDARATSTCGTPWVRTYRYHILSYLDVLYCVVPYHITQYRTALYQIVSYCILTYSTESSYTLSYLIIFYCIISYCIVSYISYHTILYHILVYGIL